MFRLYFSHTMTSLVTQVRGKAKLSCLSWNTCKGHAHMLALGFRAADATQFVQIWERIEESKYAYARGALNLGVIPS